MQFENNFEALPFDFDFLNDDDESEYIDKSNGSESNEESHNSSAG